MIDEKAREIVIERIKPCRREDAGLAHGAAQHPPDANRASDIGFAAGK